MRETITVTIDLVKLAKVYEEVENCDQFKYNAVLETPVDDDQYYSVLDYVAAVRTKGLCGCVAGITCCTFPEELNDRDCIGMDTAGQILDLSEDEEIFLFYDFCDVASKQDALARLRWLLDGKEVCDYDFATETFCRGHTYSPDAKLKYVELCTEDEQARKYLRRAMHLIKAEYMDFVPYKFVLDPYVYGNGNYRDYKVFDRNGRVIVAGALCTRTGVVDYIKLASVCCYTHACEILIE